MHFLGRSPEYIPIHIMCYHVYCVQVVWAWRDVLDDAIEMAVGLRSECINGQTGGGGAMGESAVGQSTGY